MCGRFASFLPPEALRAIFRTSNPLPNLPPTWNMAPTENALVVRRHPETGEVTRSFAIITTAANATMRQLHDRMPVILEPADWPVWLGEGEDDQLELLRPAAEDVLRLWPVSRAVNSVRNNGPDLLDRIDDPHAPPPSNARAGPNRPRWTVPITPAALRWEPWRLVLADAAGASPRQGRTERRERKSSNSSCAPHAHTLLGAPLRQLFDVSSRLELNGTSRHTFLGLACRLRDRACFVINRASLQRESTQMSDAAQTLEGRVAALEQYPKIVIAVAGIFGLAGATGALILNSAYNRLSNLSEAIATNSRNIRQLEADKENLSKNYADLSKKSNELSTEFGKWRTEFDNALTSELSKKAKSAVEQAASSLPYMLTTSNGIKIEYGLVQKKTQPEMNIDFKTKFTETPTVVISPNSDNRATLGAEHILAVSDRNFTVFGSYGASDYFISYIAAGR